MTTHTLWILGAPDPEMEVIETLLVECGERFVYATAGGRRVHPGNAYRADLPELPVDLNASPLDEVVLIECAFITGLAYGEPGTWLDHARRVVHIDHHRPGDPGFGRPPAEFLPASSLGQVVALLAQEGRLPVAWRREPTCDGDEPVGTFAHRRGRIGESAWTMVHADYPADGDDYPTAGGWWALLPEDLVLAAAADHCLGAAYRGQCPGVDPEELAIWRAESRAKFQRRSVEAVLADVATTSAALGQAPMLSLLGRFAAPVPPNLRDELPIVADMRRDPPWPELPEAAARLGIGYISGPLIGPDGRQKYTCSGSPEQLRAFMRLWAPAQGLVDVYGDPARGFAGAYAR